MQKPPKGGYRDIAQFGRALGLGPRGFRFKSGYSDEYGSLSDIR